MSLLDAKTSEGTVAVSNALTTRPKFTFHVKKTIAAISATKFLPRTHKLRVGMENGGANSFVGAFNADRKRKAGLVLRGSKMTAVESEGGESGSEDSMWAESKPTKSVKALKTVYISKRVAESESEEDDDMWAKKSGIQREREKEKKVRETAEGTNLKKDFDLIEQVDEYLLQILAEVLKVEESVLQQAHVREEVDYVFSTWRRPHLLVDYYRMHSSTPEIQNNFRR